MTLSEKTVLSVTAANDFVKRIIDNNTYLSSVSIRGEISNFTNHYKSGHFYFSIKDEQAQVKCVMFASFASKLAFEPENGMKIVAHGRISVFVRDGVYIFYVDRLEADGVGELYLKYEALKKKLASEGIFDTANKKPLPKYPRAIGVITSDTGAALQDILNITGRRYPSAHIIVYPSLVQGKGAEDDLCSGIRYFRRNKNVDVIIIGRGGGSIEDLWAFNSEALAREIYSNEIPVISAVGHETDFTICDFVADLRAPTPSAAAELAVPDRQELTRQLDNVATKLRSMVDYKLSRYHEMLDRCSNCRLLQSPGYIIDDKRVYTQRLSELIISNMTKLHTRDTGLLVELDAAMKMKVSIGIEKNKSRYASLTAKLEALNPMSVISRGYSAVFDDDGNLIKSIDDIDIGSRFSFCTTDGTVTGSAISKRRNDNATGKEENL